MKPIPLLAAVLALCAGGRPVAAGDPDRAPALPVERVALHELEGAGRATQGVALGDTHYFGADNREDIGRLHRFDTGWGYLESAEFELPGVNHIGAISFHDGFLWAGFLNAKGPRKSVVAKIRAKDLSVAATYDITADVTWIDPVCFDGAHVWVGDMSDMGIHRYRIEGERLVRDGVLRYPAPLHFSQGIQIRGDRLYSMHTFGDWDGLMEFDISGLDGEETRSPLRAWKVPETRMHLEGFDFVPGKKGEIWHAQGTVVERLRLERF